MNIECYYPSENPMKLEVGAVGRWWTYDSEGQVHVSQYIIITEIPKNVPLPDEYGCLTLHRNDNRNVSVWNLTKKIAQKLSVLELHRHAYDVAEEPPI